MKDSTPPAVRITVLGRGGTRGEAFIKHVPDRERAPINRVSVNKQFIEYGLTKGETTNVTVKTRRKVTDRTKVDVALFNDKHISFRSHDGSDRLRVPVTPLPRKR